MADKSLASSTFRKVYASLDEPVVVTVLGRAIGRWVPVGSSVTSPSIAPGGSDAVPEPLTGNGSTAGAPTFGQAMPPVRSFSKAEQAKGKSRG